MKGFILNSELSKSPDNVGIDAAQLTTDVNYFTKLNVPAIFYGAGTPTATSTVPSKIGDIYVDTNAHKMYIAEDADDVDGFIILN